jgi:metal-responsive CopG/Arc/MetJ family transcriptional regulator
MVVGYSLHMRLHIEVADELVARVDEVAGPRGRSRFIRDALESALRHHRQRELLRSARGAVTAKGHDWEHDLAGWVRDQRRADRRKIG